MKAFYITLISFLMAIPSFAQTNDVEMADAFRAEGKIYIVVAVILIILAGLFLYLIRLDRKLTKLERDKDFDGK